MGNEFERAVARELHPNSPGRARPATRHPYPQQQQPQADEPSSDEMEEDNAEQESGQSPQPAYDPDSFAAAADPRALEYDGDKPIVAKRVKGIIKWYNFKNGYGFIFREDTFEDLFVHCSAIKKENLAKKDVMPNQAVEFEVVLGDKGFEASNVTIAANGARTSRSDSSPRGSGTRTSNNNQEEFYDFEYEDSDEDTDDDMDEDDDEEAGAAQTRYYRPSTSTSGSSIKKPQKFSIEIAPPQVAQTSRAAIFSQPPVTSVKQAALAQETNETSDDADFEKQLEMALALSMQAPANAQEANSSQQATAAMPRCKLCEDEYAIVLFEPCSHLTCCVECSIRLKRCPDCAAQIEKKTDTMTGQQVAISSKIKTTDLLEKVNALEEAQKCTICMDKKKNVAFDCGHMTCQACSNNLRLCPHCRKAIRTRTKLYEP